MADRIGAALQGDEPYLISTPNLNFLVTAQTDAAFRESLLMSDPTGRGDYHGDVQAAQQANRIDKSAKFNGKPAVVPGSAQPVAP